MGWYTVSMARELRVPSHAVSRHDERARHSRGHSDEPPRGDRLLWLLTLLLAAAAAKRLLVQSRELVAGTSYAAAFDLHMRWVEASRWVAGLPVYETTKTNYPPATYALLAPLIGRLDWPTLRVVWLVICWAALLALSALAASAVRRPAARALAAVLPGAVYGTALTLGVGQLGLVALACGLGAVLLARRRCGCGWWSLAGALFAVSMVKPTLTAPWLWLLFVAAAPLAAAVAVVLYLAATLAALVSQPEPWSAVIATWLDNTRLHMGRGYGSVADAAVVSGHGSLALPLGMLVLAFFALWSWRYRRGDAWLLLGVGAVVARVFTYHYYVDDLLALVPMIALLRLATEALPAPPSVRRVARVVLAAAIAAELLPTRLFDDYGPAVATAVEAVHVVEWRWRPCSSGQRRGSRPWHGRRPPPPRLRRCSLTAGDVHEAPRSSFAPRSLGRPGRVAGRIGGVGGSRGGARPDHSPRRLTPHRSARRLRRRPLPYRRHRRLVRGHRLDRLRAEEAGAARAHHRRRRRRGAARRRRAPRPTRRRQPRCRRARQRRARPTGCRLDPPRRRSARSADADANACCHSHADDDEPASLSDSAAPPRRC